MPLYVHAPYLINVASPKNNIRHGSRKILQQTCNAAAEVGAAAVIVHPGHAEDGVAKGFPRWVSTIGAALLRGAALRREHCRRRQRRRAALRQPGPALGGDQRRGRVRGAAKVGSITCHAHAAGEELGDAVERVRASCGRIDLLHANDSRDPAGTGADRHANLGKGEMGAEALAAMIAAARAPVVVETPGNRAAMRDDLEFAREALSAR